MIQAMPRRAADDVLLLANADLRDEANRVCWPVQQACEHRLAQVLKERFGRRLVRAHPVGDQHGFIASQRHGADVLAGVDTDAPLIVLLTSWQYSHHIAPGLIQHRGPILVLANFDGTWPGLVGALCLCGTLTALGRSYSRLWSERFEDAWFLDRLDDWFRWGEIRHDLSHLRPLVDGHPLLRSPAGQFGAELGRSTLRRQDLMGLHDVFCMGMINGLFPLPHLARIGMPLEGLSQSALLHAMSLVGADEREACLRWYEERGMTFHWGDDPATGLTRAQVLEQCAMYIALVHTADRYGLTCIGVQYQQGLKDVCAASDWAEGAIGSMERYPVRRQDGSVIRPGEAIPCVNEVDMGSAIAQILMFHLLRASGLPHETTLHDIRWGSVWQGRFVWDFEISGNVPFGHLKGGIAGAHGYRQPPMYFARGGSTISGQCRGGAFVWARAHYEGDRTVLQLGTGTAHELPAEEFRRRLSATTEVWPLMNAELHGMDRDRLMAGHQSNHITVAYVPEQRLGEIASALAAMARARNLDVVLAGTLRLDA